MEDTRGTVNKRVIIVEFARERKERAEKKKNWKLTIAKCGCSKIRRRDSAFISGSIISKSIEGVSKI